MFGITRGKRVIGAAFQRSGCRLVLKDKNHASGSRSPRAWRLLQEGFLIGNGKLGAIPFGQPAMEKLSLNHDSLWSGGPFENAAYNGGNPTSDKSSSLAKIRETIFSTGKGDVSSIAGNNSNYGTFRAMANLSIVISDIKSYTGYKRSLDLSTGAHTTVFTGQDQRVYTSVSYCSAPAQACFYRLSVSNGTLPNVAVSLENTLVPNNLRVPSCGVSFVRLTGVTQIGPPRGMEYDVIARLSTGPLGMPISSCSTTSNGTMVVTGSAYGPDEPLTTFSLVVGAQTDYDQTMCNAKNKYSCKGLRPGPTNEKVTAVASTKLEAKQYQTHLQDYQALMNQFTLTLHDPWAKSEYPSESLELYQLLDRYRATSNVPWKKRSAEPGSSDENSKGERGEEKAESEEEAERKRVTNNQPRPTMAPGGGKEDPPDAVDGGSYVESLLFDYARHLFISSSRETSLPPNLQGVWSDSMSTAWSGDYHTNINLQMNHWFVNQVGLGNLQTALWRFIKDTWVPRGSETAKLLYNAAGWVVHDEINIFGHTGMNQDVQSSNYPVAPAWMMQHVYDHYDYTRDLPFLQQTGYNLMREVSIFWMSQLQQDKFSKDNTLVATPCNSPETGPTTFGCAHFQQLIYQLFETTLSAAWAVNDVDTTFTNSVDVYMSALDKGLHLGSWGEIKEWKIPDSKGFDKKGDTHRHLSHLVGWFPGYSISGFHNGYQNATIQKAVETSLNSRGIGKGADGNAGWEKIWRSTCWARLNNTAQADFELRFAIASNFADNGLSQYSGLNGPFQIDANFGIAGAMLAMLVVDLPAAYRDKGKRSVVLGPAIPKRWGPGSVQGLRIRGGSVLAMAWDENGSILNVTVTKRGEGCKFFSRKGMLIGEI
ncbi:glycoside hydrolase family 95 protein [Venturia nashicola]|uniref:Glycoside hydrolase family 95 protein n=1 Tax=Venturia nashicola TaxID=86259 RepID=A0A4Z1PKS0_9PEZI|nr:glycoside hydrolase family 95 protein [Venturia nashicola]